MRSSSSVASGETDWRVNSGAGRLSEPSMHWMSLSWPTLCPWASRNIVERRIRSRRLFVRPIRFHVSAEYFVRIAGMRCVSLQNRERVATVPGVGVEWLYTEVPAFLSSEARPSPGPHQSLTVRVNVPVHPSPRTYASCLLGGSL